MPDPRALLHQGDGRLPLPRYYAHYEDDGADHPDDVVEAGEPWNRLYVFEKPKHWLDFIHDVGEETFRLNARVTGSWAEGDAHYEEIDLIRSTDAF